MFRNPSENRKTEDGAGSHQLSLVIGPTEVADVMTSRVVTLSPHHSFNDVAHLMSDRNFRHCVVVDTHGKVVGVISDRIFCAAWHAMPIPTPSLWIRS